MDKNLSKLLLALASMDLGKNELTLLLRSVSLTPSDEIVDRVMKLRAEADWTIQPEFDNIWSRKNSLSATFDMSVGDRVERLLKNEAGLSTSTALDELVSALIKARSLDSNLIPPLSRKSFKEWIGRLARIVPEKEILRCATVIRNKYIHLPNNDWSLGKRGR